MVTTRGRQSAATTALATASKETPSGVATRGSANSRPSRSSAVKANSVEVETPETVARSRKRRRLDANTSNGQELATGNSITQNSTSGSGRQSVTEAYTQTETGNGNEGFNDGQADPQSSGQELNAHQPSVTNAANAGAASNAHLEAQDSRQVNGRIHREDRRHGSLETNEKAEAPQRFIESAAPDLSTIIESIIKHGETVDEHYAAKSLNETGVVDTESSWSSDASSHLKTHSLPILDNLSVQILNVLAKSTYQEIVTITEDPDSEAGQAYATLKSLFDHAKKVYSIRDPFLLPKDLGLSEPHHIDTIRKANLATFVSSVFGGQEVGFYHLNEYFLDTFVGEGGRLLKSQGQLFLDLKTEAFISAKSYGQRSKEELIEDIFPTDMEERLLKRKEKANSGSKQLTPSELEFLQRARNRSHVLMRDPDFQEVTSLSKRYAWEDFLRDISTYISKHFEALVGQPMQKDAPSGKSSNYFPSSKEREVEGARQTISQAQEMLLATEKVNGTDSPPMLISSCEETLGEGIQTANPTMPVPSFPNNISADGLNNMQTEIRNNNQTNEQCVDPSAQVRIISHQDSRAPPQNIHYPLPHVFQNHDAFVNESNMQSQMSTTPVNRNVQLQFYGDQPINPHPTQSAPTQILYERAREAATAKASPSSRRSGHPSQRRPWSHEEENALMAGLDRVKGPHWSQILAMFGPGGTINETLKDRNQVQLKDKARNLKLFFLKSGIEVPYYLQFVTGELKTRAPGQAAKNEAKERENGSEERAHVEGVFTLAYGPDTIQEARSAELAEQDAQIPPNGLPRIGRDTADISMENLEGRSAPENDISIQLANAAQRFSQPSHAPEANMITYNGESSITPNFQAMVDLAVAEAARVSSSGR